MKNEENRKREEEQRERLKLKRFIEMQEEIERKQQLEADQLALKQILLQNTAHAQPHVAPEVFGSKVDGEPK